MRKMLPGTHRLGAGLTALMLAGAGAIWAAPPASAVIQPVLGSAYGYKGNVSFFGGPPMVKVPTPTVKLPTGGSATPITRSAASGSIVFGPGTFLSTGQIFLSTVGTNGNATTTTSAQTVTMSKLTAGKITSLCKATGGGAALGSVSVTNGKVVTSTDANQNPTSTVAVPTSPRVNLDIHGTFQMSATDTESFDFIFNEQIHNTNGSLTVNAVHEKLHGPSAVGDIYLGDSLCRG